MMIWWPEETVVLSFSEVVRMLREYGWSEGEGDEID
jgi:hypothetical protein